MMFKSKLETITIAVLLGLTVNAVHAEEVNYGLEIPTSQQLVDVLKPKFDKFEAKTRGIVVKVRDQVVPNQSEQRPVAQQQQVDVVEDGSQNAASLQIRFDFDSAELSNYAELQLQPLGQALQSPELAGIAFTLEGHTDATGSENYNQSLSERRAMAIKQYLVTHYQVPESNLRTIGLGETSLLLPQSPAEAANRRVRIVSQL